MDNLSRKTKQPRFFCAVAHGWASYPGAPHINFNRCRTRHAAFRSILAVTPATHNTLIAPEAQGSAFYGMATGLRF